MNSKDLKVRSHVGRDVLASAAAFKTEASVVWEYVVNSLQYVDRGVNPRVQVDVSNADHRITISDNGRGIDSQGLLHFFTMHGENLDRLAGRQGRGKFGTGKSAAFGIARTLTIDTVQNGKRNVVALDRTAIESSGGKEIPVQWLMQDERSGSPNGTRVIISDVLLPRLRTAPIIDYIERHLTAFRAMAPEVAVNNVICSGREPEVSSVHSFGPSPAQASVLGQVTLTIKVSRAPLSEQEQGVAITSGPGNLVGLETAGVSSKEFGSYLFGDIDVTALESHASDLEPYDSSRSLQLNPHHPVVEVLIPFIGSKLEQVRVELVKEARTARQDEQAKRLASEAQRIAEVLNQDFRGVRQRLQDIRAASAHQGDAASSGRTGASGGTPESWIEGTQTPGNVTEQTSQGEGQGGRGRNAPTVVKEGAPDSDGTTAVDPAGGDGRGRRPRGGFAVEYKGLGDQEDRSRYDSGTLTILINLDHPVVRAAIGDGNVEDPVFRRLSYEIAFSEYAMGLGYEFFKQDPNMPADDLLYEVRRTLQRVSAAAASLYRT